jgi:hypothetical protein
MSRDRFVHVESGVKHVKEPYGYDDNGFPLNKAEAEAYVKLKAAGYTVRKHGWPDFIAEKDDDVRLIEVKRGHDPYRMSQLHNHRALKRLGIHVERLRVS